MTEDDRRERIHALAEVIDDFLDEESAFVLVIFPREEPPAKAKMAFDVVSNHNERTYVLDVLEHVCKGIDQHLLEEDKPERPN